MIQEWATAVERAKSLDPDKVVAELEKFNNEPTIEGGKTFTYDIHTQNQATYIIEEIQNGKVKSGDQWTMTKAVPLDVMLKR